MQIELWKAHFLDDLRLPTQFELLKAHSEHDLFQQRLEAPFQEDFVTQVKGQTYHLAGHERQQ
jgi:hypothetical protein